MPLHSFDAYLEAGGPSFMPTQVVHLSPLLVAAVGGNTTKRVRGTLNDHPIRLSLLPQAGGGRYLMINKELCLAAGVQVGQRVRLQLEPDPTPRAGRSPCCLARSPAQVYCPAPRGPAGAGPARQHGAAGRNPRPPGRGGNRPPGTRGQSVPERVAIWSAQY
ncbi:hypothetical protein HNQ93_000728 [Hymenobacter luteus]|uniref:DUF1905 domain-containing protein n=2 Tax=Hymenobacter TaxID=89966 RepID=A0A7W9SYM2_9BACT|nr:MULTISPECIES: DUF1905 domain-containing protein [Hymenobacter]MBB4599792.1 hypothetical protein [Hymenobacter latericoloratus]MBB6057898.1 hypothetical protein [Hymenobacter luteus]